MNIFISMIICLAVFISAGQTCNAGSIGMIMDGYIEGCTVKRGDGSTLKCRYSLELYAGDSIIKIPDASVVKIQWLAPPYTRAEPMNRTTLRIVSDRPGPTERLFAKLTDALQFIKKTPHRSWNLVTRGGDPSESCRNIITPLMGYGATLLPTLPVRFAWYGKGKTILFKGSDGKVIYRASVEGKSDVALTPEEIGLKQGITYTWEIEGIDSDELNQVRLIGKDLGDLVQRDLAEIEGAEAVKVNEKAIRKAVYLQMMSDLYPKEADLYWQSILLLVGNCEDMAVSLRNRYAQHIQSTGRFK